MAENEKQSQQKKSNSKKKSNAVKVDKKRKTVVRKSQMIHAETDQEIADQIAKKKEKRVRRDLREMRIEHTNPGDNTKYITHSLRLAAMPAVNLMDAQAVEDRVLEYFQICAEDDMKPSTTAMALALGTTREYLWEIRNGLVKTNPSTDVIKKATTVLESQMTAYLQNGQINPVAAIFLMKNHFGYRDQQEVFIAPHDPLGDLNRQELESRYMDSIPEAEPVRYVEAEEKKD